MLDTFWKGRFLFYFTTFAQFAHFVLFTQFSCILFAHAMWLRDIHWTIFECQMAVVQCSRVHHATFISFYLVSFSCVQWNYHYYFLLVVYVRHASVYFGCVCVCVLWVRLFGHTNSIYSSMSIHLLLSIECSVALGKLGRCFSLQNWNTRWKLVEFLCLCVYEWAFYSIFEVVKMRRKWAIKRNPSHNTKEQAKFLQCHQQQQLHHQHRHRHQHYKMAIAKQ